MKKIHNGEAQNTALELRDIVYRPPWRGAGINFFNGVMENRAYIKPLRHSLSRQAPQPASVRCAKAP